MTRLTATELRNQADEVVKDTGIVWANSNGFFVHITPVLETEAYQPPFDDWYPTGCATYRCPGCGNWDIRTANTTGCECRPEAAED